MAGIAGVQGGNVNALETMLASLRYRGSHETWTSPTEYTKIGCCKLKSESIQQRQLNSHANGKFAILDGHLYNATPRGLTDAALLLSLYEKFGIQFPERLDGDFSCALLDSGELVLSRDALGLKPLYYGYQGGEFYFASEAKALTEVAQEIKEFPPGHIYTARLGFQRFTPKVKTPDFETKEEAKKILVNLLTEALEKRMKDNAPEGVILSGGLDSSIIICLAKEIQPNIKAFTVTVDGGEDLPRAQDLARYLGIKHYVYTYGEEEIRKALPEAIYYLESFEEDNVRGAVAHFFASKLASQYTGCVLSGEGADEFLAGYEEQMREAKGEEELTKLIDKLITVAHNTGLQRLDRLMASHSLEFRAAFLDQKVTDFCRKLPTNWKVHGPERKGKWILREAFSDRLPQHIAFQTKRPFGSGAGSTKLLGLIAEKEITDEEFMKNRYTEDGLNLHSKEELLYYRIFKEKFKHPSLPQLVAVWDPFKPGF